jgi:hypothetical protein
MKQLTPPALAVCAALLVGCASVPLPMTSGTLDAEAKQFVPEPGKASIYVNCSRGVSAGLFAFQTVLDGRGAGSLMSNTYHLLHVSPGQHTLTVAGAKQEELQRLTAEAGRNYFFRVSLGWASDHAHHESVTEEQGRRQVLRSRRAEAKGDQ